MNNFPVDLVNNNFIKQMQEINFNSYIENNQNVEDSANAMAVFDEEKVNLVELRVL